MAQTYLGNTVLNQLWLGNIPINKVFKGWDSLVPDNLASSQLVDFMIAPYVTVPTIYNPTNDRVFDVVSGGFGTLSGNLSISNNAIVGFVSGSDELSIPAYQYYWSTYDGPFIGNEVNSYTFEFWLKPDPWYTAGVPDMSILTIQNAGPQPNITTSNGWNKQFSPFTWFSTITPSTNDQSSWSGQWVYVAVTFASEWNGVSSYDQRINLTWRTKGGETADNNILWGSKQGPNNTDFSAIFKLFGFDSLSWGVVRHYNGIRLSPSQQLANFNAEKDYFS